MNKIKIKSSDNGAILETQVFGDERLTTYAFDDDDLTGFENMLWDIVDAFNTNNSRYNEEWVSIRIVHGDKYECKNKTCKICNQNGIG